jgi:cell division protein FtsZ
MAVGLLGAPVPEDAAGPETAGSEPSPHDAAVSADTSYSSAAYSSISRPAHAELGKTFDVASTRRRPVVFEEDDDLDVPDFLK